MLFNSYIFIFLFFPLCLVGFYGLKKVNSTWAKVWLIGFSLWFYGYFNIRYLYIMILSILLNYVAYRLMMRVDGSVHTVKTDAEAANKAHVNSATHPFISKRKILITGVSANLLLLFYFKYFDFFIVNINAVFSSSIALRNIVLPLGISFFTFQQISFLADTYRGELKECRFVDYALFVSFFPQLIAGPIVTHDEMLPQFKDIGTKRFDDDTFCRGLFIFILGMGKKVLIADTFGVAVDTGYGMLGEIGSMDAVLIMLFYTLQLYFDFSGYCDMAIGIGKMMGIEITINFNSPYKACNIFDFWKRWHITLSRFFTKNIYIPLGGNRKGNARMYANLFLVFFLSGLWHGAGWNYILWGVMHGVLYCVTRWVQRNAKARIAENVSGGIEAEDEKDENKKDLDKNRVTILLRKIGNAFTYTLKVFITFLYVNAAWVFFRSESIGQAVDLFNRMFTGGIAIPSVTIAEAFNLDEFWYVLKVLHLTDFTYSKYILMVAFTIVILLATFFGKNVQEIAKKWKMSWISAIAIAIVFVWCVVSLSGVSTFLYFNF